MSAAGTITLGDLQVDRLGFGAMRITGPGVWGPPAQPPDGPDGAIALLRRAVELGVNFIDTADSYGPNVSEELIAQALAPYDGVIVATKAGLVRPGPGVWNADGRPEHLREALEGSLRRLRRDQIDLYQFHRPDPDVPFEESLGTFVEAKRAGKIRHIGLSEVTVEQIEAVRKLTPIVSVQNRYNLIDRQSEPVLDYCTREQLGFIPWFPLATGGLAKAGGPVERDSKRLGATPSQLALAWLLRKSPVMLPIPGTSSVPHLEENTAAALVELDDATFEEMDAGEVYAEKSHAD